MADGIIMQDAVPNLGGIDPVIPPDVQRRRDELANKQRAANREPPLPKQPLAPPAKPGLPSTMGAEVAPTAQAMQVIDNEDLSQSLFPKAQVIDNEDLSAQLFPGKKEGFSVGGLFGQAKEAFESSALAFSALAERFGQLPEMGGPAFTGLQPPTIGADDSPRAKESMALSQELEKKQQERMEGTNILGKAAYGAASFLGSHAAGVVTGTPTLLATEAMNDLSNTWARHRTQGVSDEEATKAGLINAGIGTGGLALFGPLTEGAGAAVNWTLGSLGARLGGDTVRRVATNAIVGSALFPTQQAAESYAEKLQFNPNQTFEQWWTENLPAMQQAALTGAASGLFGILPAGRKESAQLNEDNRKVQEKLAEPPGVEVPVGPPKPPEAQPTPTPVPTKAEADVAGWGAKPRPLSGETQQKLDSLDPPPEGHIRIYRAGGKESDSDSNAGRWGTTNEQDLQGYIEAKRATGQPADISYIDVAEKQAESWRGDRQEDSVAAYTNKGSSEYFLPKDVPWRNAERPAGLSQREAAMSNSSGGWTAGWKDDWGWVEQAAGGAAKPGEVRVPVEDANKPWLAKYVGVLQGVLDRYGIKSGVVFGSEGMRNKINAVSKRGDLITNENGLHVPVSERNAVLYLSEKLAEHHPTHAVFTTMHEVGHMLVKHFFDKAPFAIQQAIRTDYLRVMREGASGKYKYPEFMRMFRGAAGAEARGMETGGTVTEEWLKKHKNIFTFSEFLADRFAEYEARTGLIDTPQGRFFTRAVAISRRIHKEMSGQLGYEQSSHDWIQGLAERGEYDPKIVERMDTISGRADEAVRRAVGLVGEERGFARGQGLEKLERINTFLRKKGTEEGRDFALVSAFDPRHGVDWDHFLKVMEATDTGAFDREEGEKQPEKAHQAQSYERMEDRIDRSLPIRNKEAREIARDRKARTSADMTYYNKFLGFTGALLDIADKNLHIPGVKMFKDYIQHYHIAKMTIKAVAMDNIKAWRKLSKDKSNILAKVLYEEDARGKAYTLQEMQAAGFTADIKDVYDKVRSHMEDILNQMEAVSVRNAVLAHRGNPVALGLAMSDINAKFRAMRAKAYFPHSRFGKKGLKLIATRDVTVDGKQYKAGDTISVSHHDTSAERDNWQADLQRQTGPNAIHAQPFEVTDRAADGMRGLPPEFANELVKVLNLNTVQESTLRDLQYKMAPHQSFIKHLIRRKGTKGFSKDAQRVYAAYMQRAANGISRMVYLPSMREAIKEIHNSAQDMSKRGIDPAKRTALAQWFEKTLDYVQNPGHDGAMLRALGFHWFLGFNIKSAMVNLVQPLITTYPYLAARYGDVAAVKAMSKAFAKSIATFDLVDTIAQKAGFNLPTNKLLSADEKLMLDQGRKEGWRDETNGAMLAGEADPSVFARYVNASLISKGAHALSTISSGPFRHTELFNRKISALASYELARKSGKGHDDAVSTTRDAVQKTQFEYAPWNRPQWARGYKGVAFLFGQYEANMLRFAFGGDPGWWRAQLMMAALGGAAGIPLAGFVMDLIDLTKKFISPNTFSDTAKDTEEFFNDLDLNGDLMMHGLSRYTMGLGLIEGMPQLDISSSIGMGYTRFLGGKDAIKDVKSGDANRLIMDQISNWGGPYANFSVELARAAMSKEMDGYRRWHKLLPSTVNAFTEAWRREDPTSSLVQSISSGLPEALQPWYLKPIGGRRDKNGNVSLPYDYEDHETRSEQTAKYFNFEATQTVKQMEEDHSAKEMINFYQARRSWLTHSYVTMYKEKDREGLADVKAAIDRYNSEVPNSVFKLTPKDIFKEVKAALRTKMLTEHGEPAGVPKKYYDVYKGYAEGKGKRAVTTPEDEEAPESGVGPR